MANSRRDTINNFLRCSSSEDKNGVLSALEKIQPISSSEGLSEGELESLIKVYTSNKTTSVVRKQILQCLVPERTVSNKALKDLLSWYFNEITNGTISKATQKEFILWLTGIVHFELGDVSVIDSYFHSFLFLLRHDHLESVVSKLLCLLLKPEDAKRWTVKKILEIQKKNGPKPHTNALLSILKSFRPDVVPESVPLIRMNYENSKSSDCFRLAHERRIHSSGYVPASTIEISWNQSSRYDVKKSGHLPRLIPTPETIDFEPSTKYTAKKFSIVETRNMSSLGANCLRIEIPSQTMSLLKNVAGFHVLSFSDSVTKTRFSHKLRHTLFRVFLMGLEPYSTAEKTAFLDSLIGLQEYIHEGIPAVTEFLLQYLFVWDGDEFRDQILNLLQWLVLKSAEHWQKYLFRPLRQKFRCCGQYTKYLIIQSMSSLLRNLIASTEKDRNTFFDDSPVSNITFTGKVIHELAAFVGELVSEGIIWNTEEGRREIMTAAICFYDICSILECSEDFPVVVVMPPALVYACLFSGSRVYIARMCSLLLSFWRNMYVRLLRSRNVDEYSVQIEQTYIFILDYYRALWSSTDYEQFVDSFIFRHKYFHELHVKFQESFAVNIKRIFNVENNATFVGHSYCSRRNGAETHPTVYSSIHNLKQFWENGYFEDGQRYLRP